MYSHADIRSQCGSADAHAENHHQNIIRARVAQKTARHNQRSGFHLTFRADKRIGSDCVNPKRSAVEQSPIVCFAERQSFAAPSHQKNDAVRKCKTDAHQKERAHKHERIHVAQEFFLNVLIAGSDRNAQKRARTRSAQKGKADQRKQGRKNYGNTGERFRPYKAAYKDAVEHIVRAQKRHGDYGRP